MTTKLGVGGLTIDHAIWLAITEQCGDDLIYIRKFASTDVLSADVAEDIWYEGGTLSYLSSAETLNVVSASTDDTLAGTGARYILINGLDNDYNMVSETIVTNGTTNVETSNEYLRVYRCRVVGAGSGEKNAGKITFTASSAGTVQAAISAGDSITKLSHFTIPAGYTGISIDTNFSVYRSSGNGTRGATIDVVATSPIPVIGGRVQYVTNEYGLVNTGTNTIALGPRLPATIPPKTDLKYTVTAESNNTRASIQYTMLLVKNDFTGNVSVP